MGIFDFIIGKGSLDKQRQAADASVNSQYDASIYNPALQDANYMASEGIADAPIREKMVNSLFGSNRPDLGVYGGNQAAAVSGNAKNSMTNTKNLATAELDIAMAEEQAKLTGRSKTAEIMSKMKETEATRLAMLQENRALAEAEASRRKFGVVSGLIGLGAAYFTGGASVAADATDVGTTMEDMSKMNWN